VGSTDFRAWPFRRYRQGGNYYVLAEGGDSSQTPVNGAVYATPLPVWQSSVEIAALGLQVLIVGDAGSKIRLGIYVDEDLQGGAPGGLLVDAGTINGDQVSPDDGRQEITFSPSLRLNGPAMYWAVLCVQGAPSVQPTIKMTSGYTPGAAGKFSDLVNLFSGGYKREETGLTGALPTVFTTSVYSYSRQAKLYIKTR
jgi:hypothetical protein